MNREELDREMDRLRKTVEMHYLLYQEALNKMEELSKLYGDKGSFYMPLKYREEPQIPDYLTELETKVLTIVKKKKTATSNDVYKSSRRFKSSGLTTADIGKVLKSLANKNFCYIVPTYKGVKVTIYQKGTKGTN
ncbi:hypothetical protein [Geminocystis sp. NIES-3709]|uniref:hypothetical protein n=1 Tax=Geminocystis sp. NIES-3709 TaxID=1617448 RepID=UPI00082676C9|nr:hypothetical protein [Geminocystis sp. NIES-3709]